MEKDAIEIFRMGGLKCDAPKCGYVNEYVPPSDYKNWIGCPCPKCGTNLLTKRDYWSFKRFLFFIKVVNKIGRLFPRIKSSIAPFEGHIEWHGDYGKPTIVVKTRGGQDNA